LQGSFATVNTRDKMLSLRLGNGEPRDIDTEIKKCIVSDIDKSHDEISKFLA